MIPHTSTTSLSVTDLPNLQGGETCHVATDPALLHNMLRVFVCMLEGGDGLVIRCHMPPKPLPFSLPSLGYCTTIVALQCGSVISSSAVQENEPERQ